jgi:Sugar (and other) transporter
VAAEVTEDGDQRLLNKSTPSSAGVKAFLDLFSAAMVKPMLTALVLSISLQLTGINSFLYYATDIFEQAGFNSNSLLPTVWLNSFSPQHVAIHIHTDLPTHEATKNIRACMNVPFTQSHYTTLCT